MSIKFRRLLSKGFINLDQGDFNKRIIQTFSDVIKYQANRYGFVRHKNFLTQFDLCTGCLSLFRISIKYLPNSY